MEINEYRSCHSKNKWYLEEGNRHLDNEIDITINNLKYDDLNYLMIPHKKNVTSA